MKSLMARIIQLGCGFVSLVVLLSCGMVFFINNTQRNGYSQRDTYLDGVVLVVDAEKDSSGSLISESVVFEYHIGEQTLRGRDVFNYDTGFYVGQTVPVVYTTTSSYFTQSREAHIIGDSPLRPYLPAIIGTLLVVLSGLVAFRKQRLRETQNRIN